MLIPASPSTGKQPKQPGASSMSVIPICKCKQRQRGLEKCLRHHFLSMPGAWLRQASSPLGAFSCCYPPHVHCTPALPVAVTSCTLNVVKSVHCSACCTPSPGEKSQLFPYRLLCQTPAQCCRFSPGSTSPRKLWVM